MKINPNLLTDQGYTLLDKLEHNELLPFIQLYLKKTTRFSVLYFLANGLIVAFIAYSFFNPPTGVIWYKAFPYLFYGIGFTLILIPIHELLHALAYKMVGAKETSYDADFRKFIFMAMADKFVANRNEFILVALLPFLGISIIAIILFAFVSALWTFTLMGVLLMHTAACSGDFGMLSYLDFHRGKEVVTYDDKENKVSYFYSK